MIRWTEVVADAPTFAARVRALFDSGTNKTLATIRRDGAPRISGTELGIDDERITLGMMPASRKLADVLHDPRVAIHSPTLEPPPNQAEWPGEAKLSGVLTPIEPPPNAVAGGEYFELDIREVATTRLDDTGTLLVIESWHPGRGYSRVERS